MTREIIKQVPLKRKDRIGIAVGSRGISQLSGMVKRILIELKEAGAIPVIIPAMGSHGGATATGQGEVLRTLGITRESMGVELSLSMEVEIIGELLSEVPVYFSSEALKVDHLICVNRIKPHTKFRGEVASGIAKMLCVGLGKHKGAEKFHRYVLQFGFDQMIKEMSSLILRRTSFRYGIGVLENAYGEILDLGLIKSDGLLKTEKALLNKAKVFLPRLPYGKTDLLVLGQIGKDISGAGMDPNVTGRTGDLGEDDFSSLFNAKRIVALNLSRKTGGNALGVGNADVITDRLLKKIDRRMTNINAIAGISLNKAKIPISQPNDLEAIRLALSSIEPVKIKDIRITVLKDTLSLERFWVSQAHYMEIQNDPLVVSAKKISLPFDAKGELKLFEGL
ncbi:MAG: DUF362 domain-containing protein [Deltaproteobacteria bacterium]|nr:DUF362 domain-containing protein [Deltaproteobacteria bacterium]